MTIARRTFVGAALSLALLGCRRSDQGGELADGLYPVKSKEPMELDQSDFIPLVLERPAEAAQQSDGRTYLTVELARKYQAALESFTRRQLGRQVAVVVDGQIVTVHKVQEVIRGGRMKITRCRDDGCERILSKLVD